MKYVILILITLYPDFSKNQDLISIANTFLNDKNYVEAKKAIDEAFDNIDVSSNPRAWYTKARIYHEILKSEDNELNPLKQPRDRFVKTIIEGYEKTRELTPSTNNLYILATNQIEILWAAGINNGYSFFQKGEFKKALASFEISKQAKPRDTTAYINAGISAQNAGLYREAINNYEVLKTLTRLSKPAYNGLIISKQLSGATLAEQLDVVEEALFEYPNYIPYVIQEVRLLVRLEKYEEAESVLNTSLRRNPNNAALILRRADLYDRIFKAAYLQGSPEQSEAYFERASDDYERYLASFPNDFTANYNYAVMINEQANRVYVRINLMSKEQYQISGKETEEIGHEWTRRALPYMEQAIKIKPGDENATKALIVFYDRLGMEDKLAQLNGN